MRLPKIVLAGTAAPAAGGREPVPALGPAF